MARTFTLKIEGKEYEVDDLTLDEMAAVEELAGGVPFSDLNFGAAQTMKALAYTLRKRDQPDVTMEQIGQLKMLELVAGDEEMPPLPPAEGAPVQNGSQTPGGSGAHPSPGYTPGSARSTSAS